MPICQGRCSSGRVSSWGVKLCSETISAGRLRANAADVAAAAELLRGARRPLIVAGGGVLAAGAEAAVSMLATAIRAPVLPTQMALGIVASDSAQFIGHGGIIGGDAIPLAFAEADVVIAIGCRFSSWLWDERGPLVRPHHRLININIDAAALGRLSFRTWTL